MTGYILTLRVWYIFWYLLFGQFSRHVGAVCGIINNTSHTDGDLEVCMIDPPDMDNRFDIYRADGGRSLCIPGG